MLEKLKKLAHYTRRLWWLARIHWAMERWYRARRHARRRFEKVDRMMWRYDVLFGENEAGAAAVYSYNGVKLPNLLREETK